MFKLQINAQDASKTASMVREQKAEKERELFKKQVQETLDAIVQFIIKAADAGEFETVVSYVSKEPEYIGEDDLVIPSNVLREVKNTLRDGNYEVKDNNKELKISWPDPEDDDLTK